MVDRADLPRINALDGEKRSIQDALDAFDAGGTITRLTVEYEAEVSTVGMAYPPQMVDAIKQFLQSRRVAIEQELSQLGITGIDVTGVAQAAPTTPPAARIDPRTGRPIR